MALTPFDGELDAPVAGLAPFSGKLDGEPEGIVDTIKHGLSRAKDYDQAIASGINEGIANTIAGAGTFIQAPAANALSGLAGAAALADRGVTAAANYVSPGSAKLNDGIQGTARSASQFAAEERANNVDSNFIAKAGLGLQEFGREHAKYAQDQNKRFNPELLRQQQEMAGTEGFIGALEGIKDNPMAFTHTLARSAPDMMIGAGVAKGVASGIAAAGGSAARQVAGASTAGIVSEAASSANQGREGVYQQVAEMPLDRLGASPRFNEILAQTGDAARAREILANELADQVPLLSAAGTALGSVVTNKLFGGDTSARMIAGVQRTTGKDVLKNIGQESTEEGFQGVPEDLVQHGAVVQADPSKKFDLGKTIAENAAAGLAMGGGGSIVSYARDNMPSRKVPQLPDTGPLSRSANIALATKAADVLGAPAESSQFANNEPAAADTQPASLAGPDRVAAIGAEEARVTSRLSELAAGGYGPAFDVERADLQTRAQELAGERESLTASWPKATTGAKTSFSTESGNRLTATYALMSAGDLNTSHDENLKPSKSYPAELQPRERDRAASEMQVSGIAQRLDPARLGESADAATGAPIVGADGLVESGNARTIALKRVYQSNPQKADEYKQFLRDNAARFGLTPEAIDAVPNPVLVRVRETPVDRAEFARQANASTVAQMSSSETAKADAARLDTMDDLRPTDDGDFITSRDFIRRFISRLPSTEQAGMIDAGGQLSQTGYTRIRNAVLAKAYGESPVLARMVESMDDNMRNVGKALMQAAPEIAKLRQDVSEGALFDADITPDLMAAVEELSRLKDSGKSVAEELAQSGMFGYGISPEAQALLAFLDQNIRRPRKIAEFIQRYIEALRAAGNPNQGSLLGEAQAPAKGDLLQAALGQDNAEQTGQPQGNQATGAQAGQQQGGAQGNAGAAQSEWVTFPPETGTLGIPRANMPQVKGEHRGALIQYLDGKGITYETRDTPASEIKPTQAEFSTKKAEKWGEVRDGADRSVLVSSDGYILDGHHQWIAALAAGDNVKTITFNAPIKDLLTEVHQFPSVQRSEDHANAAGQARAREDFQAALADLGVILRDFAHVARMVPENTPDLMPTLVKLFESGIQVVGFNMKTLVAHVKKAAKANEVTKRIWNKISDAIYLKAARQAVENVMSGTVQAAPSGQQDMFAPTAAPAQPDLFAQPAAVDAGKAVETPIRPANKIVIDQVEYDLDAPNFGMSAAPITLKDGDPLLVETYLKPADSTVVFQGETVTRAAMRQSIEDGYFSSATPAPGSRKPIAYVMGGGGASGKGFVKKHLIKTGRINETGAVSLDPDEVKPDIPEYSAIIAAGDSRAAAVTHEESSDIAKRIKARAIAGRYDIVLDVTLGDQKKGEKYLQELKDAGYEVRLFGVTVNPEMAVIRAMNRAQKTGRYVPISALLHAHKGFNGAFESYANIADEAVLFDNTTERQEIAHAAGGILEITNQEAYNRVAERSQINERARTLREISSGSAENSRRDERGRVAGSQEEDGRPAGRVGEEAKTGTEGTRSAGSSLRRPGMGDEVGNSQSASEVRKSQEGSLNEHGRPGSQRPEGTEPVAVQQPAAQREAERVPGRADGRNQDGGAQPATGDRQGAGNGREHAADGAGRNPENGGRAGARRSVRRDAGIPAGRDIPVKTGRNYAFGDSDLTYEGSWLVKARQNVEALELLKQLEKDGRQASRDEQSVLAKFIGWGSSDLANSLFGDKLTKQLKAISDYDDALAMFERAGKDSLYRGGRSNGYYKAGDTGYYAAFNVLNAKADGKLNYYDPALETITRKQIEAAKPDMAAKKWAELRDRIKSALTPDEWNEASRSTQYAHYTSKPVVKAMWSALERMGFKGGAILEPGAGIGVFPGLMASGMANNSIYTGIEFDSITGGILKQLFPDERILVESFIDSKLPKNFYDVAAGNPPFHNTAILADPAYRKYAFALHDYFFAKSIDSVKPGGLVMFVTSRYTMDKLNDKARAYLAERADLVGAIRLPQTAFKKNAGTDVVTDVLFLRKKVDGETFEHAQPWAKSVPMKVGSKSFPVNEYFHAHPEMVLGKPSDKGSMANTPEPQYTVEAIDGDIDSLFEKAAATLPANIYKAERGSAAESAAVRELDFNPKAKKEGNFYVTDAGVLMQLEGGVGVRAEEKHQKNAALIKDFVGLRDALKQAHYDQLNDGDWEKSLAALQKSYRAFVKQHGQVNQFTEMKRTVKVEDPDTGETIDDERSYKRFPLLSKIDDDPDYTSVMALESINEETGNISESAFLTDRVLGKPAQQEIRTPADALLSVLNDIGHVDIDAIADRLGMENAEVVDALGTMVYEDPAAGWVMADEYLSGNVKKKLAAAQEAVKSDRRFTRNIDALLAVQPVPVAPSEITVAIGMNWIPEATYEQFLLEKTGIRAKVNYNERTGQWSVVASSSTGTLAATQEWGTPRRSADDILLAALTGAPIRITETVKESGGSSKTVFLADATEAANQKLAQMREAFRDWMWQDAGRTDKLVALYNDTFNTIVPRAFDGRHLTLPGTSQKWKVFDHVKRGAWRIIQSGNTYLAHAVGSGKAQPLDAKVLTPNGWKLMGDIDVGDFVVSADGTPTMVEAVFPQGEKEIFRVEFSDGSATECCDEHLWLTQTYKERSASQRAVRLGKHWPHGLAKVRSLAEIRETLVAPHLGAKNHSIPMVAPVQFSARPLEIDPYVMGALLGDGGMTGSSVILSCADDEILSQVSARLPDECELVHRSSYDYALVWRGQMRYRAGGGMVASHPVQNALRALGLMGKPSHQKFIPDDYLFNTTEARIALLQGLMDTDGCVEGGGTSTRFTTTSRLLADGVTALVRSLGGIVREREKAPTYMHNGERRFGRIAFDLCLSLPAWINPFRLSRKASRVIPKSKYAPIRYITAVVAVGRKAAQCIRVAHPSHLYVTDDFVVTHNTFEMIISAMEQKRLGLIKKPMMVVPNHMLQQFAREWIDLYPAARLMVADEKNFHTENRRRFSSRVAMSDLDGVIITHSAFKLLDLDPAFKQKMIEQELDFLRAAFDEAGGEEGKKSRDPKIKQIESKIEKMEQKLEAAMSGAGKDKNVRFDEMGVDMVYVDEAHEFRKLAFATQRQVKGIDSSGSDRAFDLWMKTRWLEEKKPGRSLVMASGTPVTNTLAELFSVQRFMAPQVLEERGLDEFDAWASMFGQEHTEIEADASGKYAPVTRFSKFVNVPELTQMFREFADVLTSDHLAAMLGDKRPKVQDGSRKIVITPQTSAYQGFKRELAERLAESRAWKPSKDEPNNPDPVIKIIGDGRLASIDMRFIDPSLPSDPDSKLNRMADEVIRVFKETANNEYKDKEGKVEPNKGATQIVFSDLGFGAGVAENRGFNARAWFEKRLRDAGVPPAQVAFMSDHKKSQAKLKLFKDINAGRVRIVVGSSKNMGTGVNAQQRLIALHHLDTPWYPADLEQREGRIVRQGNKNPLVQLYAYSTKGSYDAVMWQMLASKQRFIDQALSGDSSVRSIDDLSESSQFQIATAMTSDDERAIQLAGLRAEIEKLQRLYRAHEEQRAWMKQEYDWAGETIRVNTQNMQDAKQAAGKVQNLSGDNFTAKADGRSFDVRKEFGEALMARFKDYSDKLGEAPVKIGEISGFDIMALGRTGQGQGYRSVVFVDLPEPVSLTEAATADPVGVALKATNALANLSRLPAQMQQKIDEAAAKRNALEARITAPFPMAEMLSDKIREAQDLETAMLADQNKLTGLEREQQLEDVWQQKTGAITPLFSRGNGSSGMSLRDLSAVVDRVSKRLKNLPKVHVLESPAALSTKDPAQKALRDFIRKAGAWEDAEGATHEGEIYLFASGLADEARAEHVLATHEVTHYGLRGAIGKDLDAALQVVWMNNTAVRKAAAALKQRNGLQSNIEATEEVMADMTPGDLVKLQGWRRVLKAVRDWLGRAGFDKLAARVDTLLKSGLDGQQQADLMVADLVTAARDWVKNGKGSPYMEGTRLADGSLAEDATAQEKWLTREAKARGYASIDDMAEKNYKVFENLAKLWREKHPADALLSRSAAVDQTKTPEFKRWFGDSKVVDADGKPLVVYHATTYGDFNEFTKAEQRKGMAGFGFYFSDRDGSNVYAEHSQRFKMDRSWNGVQKRINTMPVFLRMDNPLRVDNIADVASRFKDQGAFGVSRNVAGLSDDAKTAIQRAGYDGVITNEYVRKKRDGSLEIVSQDAKGAIKHPVFVVFEPTQIKSAIGNNGNFDGSNPDIRMSRATGSQTANQSTVAQRAEEIISKPVAAWRPIDTVARMLTTTVRLDRLTSAVYDRAAHLLDRYTPESVKAGVVSDYGVPESVLDQRTLMQGRMRVQLRKSGELIDKLATLTRAESRVAYEWMNNNDPQARAYFEAQLPEESVKVMEEVKDMIDKLSQEAVALGQLDPEAFKRNRFEYLRRSYIKHTTELTKSETAGRKRAIAILGDQYKGRGMTDAVDMAKFKNVAPEWWGRKLNDGQADKGLKGEKFIRLERRAPVGEGVGDLQPAQGPGETNPQKKGRLLEVAYWPAGEPLPAKYSTWDQSGTWEVRDTKGGKLIVWRDFTKAERVAMGEIDEARYAIAKSLHGMIHDVETGRYLEWLAQRYAKKPGEAIDGEIVDASERMRDTFAPGEWVQVPETKIPGTSVLKYGKLAGLYLPGPIWNDVRQTVGFRFKPLGETYAAILGAWKTSKALALDTPIPTPDGWTTMGEIRVGDSVFDENGNVCIVMGATEVQHERKCYEVAFSDGTKIVADAEHRWFTIKQGHAGVRTTDEIRATLKERTRGDANHKIPVAAALDLPNVDLPIPPYALGAWLGDGDTNTARLSIGGDDLDEMLEQLESSGVRCGLPRKDKRNNVYTVGIKRGHDGCCRGHSKTEQGKKGCRICNNERRRLKTAGAPYAPVTNQHIQVVMRNIGLLGNKHIPAEYLRASEDQRRALLHGLMDTDGHVDKRGMCAFTTTLPALRDGVLELVRSLGYKPTLRSFDPEYNGKKGKQAWVIGFKSYSDKPAFSLSRKKDRLRALPARPQRSQTRQIVSITEVKSVPVRCIAVSSKSRLYLAGDGMVPTHNTALSPAVHTNNVMANFVMADWHDVSASHILKALRIILGASQREGKGIIGRAGNAASRAGIVDSEAAREVINRFMDSGANLGSWVTAELQKDQLEPLLAALENEIGTVGESAGTMASVSTVLQLFKAKEFRQAAAQAAISAKNGAPGKFVVGEAKSLIDLYEAEDQVFRLAAWLKAKEDGAADSVAGKIARRSFLDYHINAPWIQAMRNTAFPFISFTYRAVPMMLEVAAKKPHKIMKLAMMAAAVNALGYLLSGGDEDDERRLLPEEKAGGIWGMVPKLVRMPWNSDMMQGGQKVGEAPVFLDIRRFVPVGDIFDTGATHSAVPLLPFAVPGGPLALVSELVANKSQFTGRAITLETDTPAEKAAKVADHLYKAFAPNIVILPGTYAWTGVSNAATGRTDSFGREQSTAQAAASAFGIKLGSYPADVLQLNAQRETQAKMMEIDRNITQLKREYQRSGITDEEFMSRVEAQQAKKTRIMEDFQRRAGE